MIKKSTEELMNELLKANNIGEYLKDNSQYMVSEELSTYLNNIISKKALVKSEVIKKTEFSEVMGYQIFSGTRLPSRDSLICICVAMEMALDETQAILKIAGFAALYETARYSEHPVSDASVAEARERVRGKGL